MARGSFLTFEGIDGSGKSTHARRLAQWLREEGFEVVEVRDPGTTAISEAIRGLLLDPKNSSMTRECELLLYEAARAQLVREAIEPALARGAWVVADRFFDSTTAYQGGGRALAAEYVERANALGSLGLMPDLTLVFDVDVAEAERRRGGELDRMELEGASFENAVREAYLALAADAADRVCVIDASGSPDETFALARAAVEAHLRDADRGR